MEEPVLVPLRISYKKWVRPIGPGGRWKRIIAMPMGDYLSQVLRFTRHWIHYGFLAHTTVCIVVAAVKGWLGP